MPSLRCLLLTVLSIDSQGQNVIHKLYLAIIEITEEMIHLSACMSWWEEEHKETRQMCRGRRDDEIIKSNDKVVEGAQKSRTGVVEMEVDKEGGGRVF